MDGRILSSACLRSDWVKNSEQKEQIDYELKVILKLHGQLMRLGAEQKKEIECQLK
jgi:hypothetical protein